MKLLGRLTRRWNRSKERESPAQGQSIALFVQLIDIFRLFNSCFCKIFRIKPVRQLTPDRQGQSALRFFSHLSIAVYDDFFAVKAR